MMRTARVNSLSKLVVCSTLAFGIGAAVPALTNYSTGTVSASPARVTQPSAKVYIDGEALAGGQSAVVINGATMVPMRAIFEKLGANISWNQATKTVKATKGDTNITLVIGEQTALINGNKVTLTKEAVVYSGSTLVPLRFVSEALGATASWDRKTRTATIITGSEQSTIPSQNPVIAVAGNGGTHVKYSLNFEVINIFVKYGTHHYESKTQAEYDKVMEIVADGMKDYKTKPFYSNFGSDPEVQRGIQDALKGVALTYKGEEITPYWEGYLNVNGALKSMRENGVSTEKAVEAHTIFGLAVKAMNSAESATNSDANIRSAYDNLVLGRSDCDSFANTMLAFYDSAGYSTQIRANETHADGYVKIEDAGWFKISGGLTFAGKTLTFGNGVYLYTAPTY